ncbi:glycosyltransferase family 2 protein [Prosthecomicrobium sp. N25]|uniref:glycosyltransferase family 2 protein n=1 Tax=Prosthecomicrobium sp. N25 TaxID=3129254 RepID=UPI0030784CC7
MVPRPVSVIVPAYNASQFLERTLDSALKQTISPVEILVVDDGSKDRTPEIVRQYEKREARVRLIQQTNAGVAAARNTGIRLSQGEYIAPLDADDLWAPHKLERQVARLEAGGADVGYVYTLYRLIEADDTVVFDRKPYRPEGWVFLQQAIQNFIGCGSSVLMRRSAVFEMGGYSSRLREEGLEGCEDLFLQLSIAASYRVLAVPEHLLGYRRTPNNMSSDWYRMAQSRRAVLESFLARSSGEVAEVLQDALFRTDLNVLRVGLKRMKLAAVARVVSDRARIHDVRLAEFAGELKKMTMRRLGRAVPSGDAGRPQGRRFEDYEPDELVDGGPDPDLAVLMARARAVDAVRGGRYLDSPPELGHLAADPS